MGDIIQNCSPSSSTSSNTSSNTSSSNYERYLNQATESNPSMILELDLNGNIRYISPIWKNIIGTEPPKPDSSISDIIVGSEKDKSVFIEVLKLWTENDTISYTITFDVNDSNNIPVTLEACGILIHNTITQLPTHSMWIIKPYDITLQENDKLTNRLPEDFIKMLGFGSFIFMEYLNYLETQLCTDESNLPDPNLELCRVCENFLPDWWLESHSKSCVCEHRIQSAIQIINDSIIEHINFLTNILEGSEQEMKENRIIHTDYKDLPVQLSYSVLKNLIELSEMAADINSSKIGAETDQSMLLKISLSGNNNPQYCLRYQFSPKSTSYIQDITD
ncbi:hypothetical protein Kpol_1035p40, partial [Vanderwaltozyma polyspora DSM 70294]